MVLTTWIQAESLQILNPVVYRAKITNTYKPDCICFVRLTLLSPVAKKYIKYCLICSY